jgi:hypothetical protein
LWGDLWLQLWGCYPKDKKLGKAGWDWVKNRFLFDETAWYSVWNTLLDSPEALPAGVNKTQILRIGVVWLNERENRRWWSRIWENLLDNNNDLPSETNVSELVQVGVNWLRGREDSGQWSFVWQGVIKYSQAFRLDSSFVDALDYGIQWLDGRQDQAQWAFVWQDIIKYIKIISPEANTTKLFEVGVKWLLEKESSNQWSFVWQTLISNFEKIQSSTIKTDLIKSGWSWVSNNRDKKEWPIIYNALARLEFCREFRMVISSKKFCLYGLEWIDTHKDEFRAAHLALFLAKSYHTPDLETHQRLLGSVRSMVYRSNIRADGWHLWWLAYWEFAPTIKTVNIALKWMEAYSGNLEGARSIINKLMSTTKTGVIESLDNWQKEHPENPISEIIKAKLEKEKNNESS